MAKYTLAFAGDGETSEENIKHLLNDFLGLGPEDKEGYPELPEDLDVEIILPLTDTHVTDSLMDVFDYLEYADISFDLVVEKDADKSSKDAKALLKYAENTDEVDAANPAIIDLLAQAKQVGREARLILFWGEEGSKDAEILLDLAASADIPANDITAGLDDLSFNDPTEDEAPAEEPTPEPEPEERPRRGRRRAAQVEEPKALEDEPEPEPGPEEKPSRRRGRARTEEPAPDLERETEGATEPAPDLERGSEEPVAEAPPSEPSTPADTRKADLVNRVSYHPANDVTVPLHEAVRAATLEFITALDDLLPEGREKSLAFTNAEQAMFWANAAVARSGLGAEASEKPSRGRGRPRKDGADPQPRTAKDKAVTEIWNDETEEWERKGPGRVPKGAKTRLIDPKTGDVVDE